ncbi:phosphatase PAP2 family protein [Flavicella sediminum]|uniref:phosphatase PAP2 family protein n=1 Tax=Flavicella sediminum TaxID=2585141 RepID=UPI00111E49FF|nr:phosphatase PAP2 family protein [Flavicella sediminum]
MPLKLLPTLALIFCSITFNAQHISTDTIGPKKTNFQKIKPYIIPISLVAYGLASLNSSGLKNFDKTINSKLKSSKKNSLDDFTMLAPTLAVYGLNLLEKKGKHNFKERTLLIGTASVFMLTTVTGLKAITQRTRPNLENNESFPSGHTAVAFMGAEFLHQEYKHKSAWYGIAGYTIAAGTGYLRMHNNKHWFSDVVTGAGIGIICTKLAYQINPYLQKKFFKNKETAFISPFYNGEQLGLSLIKSF